MASSIEPKKSSKEGTERLAAELGALLEGKTEVDGFSVEVVDDNMYLRAPRREHRNFARLSCHV